MISDMYTYVFALVFSCAVSLEWSDLSSHNVAYMFVWLFVYSYKKFSISKISLDFKNSKPKCVSGHSEQLWFLNPPQGSTWAQTDPKIPLPHFGQTSSALHLFLKLLFLSISLSFHLSIYLSFHLPIPPTLNLSITSSLHLI